MQARKVELEAQIKASQDAVISIPKLEHTVELLRQQLKDPDFAAKRDFMRVWELRFGLTVRTWKLPASYLWKLRALCTRNLYDITPA